VVKLLVKFDNSQWPRHSRCLLKNDTKSCGFTLLYDKATNFHSLEIAIREIPVESYLHACII